MAEEAAAAPAQALNELTNEYDLNVARLDRAIAYVDTPAFNDITLAAANVRLDHLKELWTKFNELHASLTRLWSAEQNRDGQIRMNDQEDR